MSDTSFSTPEQAKRFRCSQRKTDMECPQEFKDGDDGNDNEPFRSESNTYDGFPDLLDPNNQGLQVQTTLNMISFCRNYLNKNYVGLNSMIC